MHNFSRSAECHVSVVFGVVKICIFMSRAAFLMAIADFLVLFEKNTYHVCQVRMMECAGQKSWVFLYELIVDLFCLDKSFRLELMIFLD